MTEKIELAASRLRQAEEDHTVCEPIRDLIGTTDLESAYRIQEINAALRIDSGARIIGHKIGLTAPVIQQQLGVDQPDFGMLWDDREIQNGGQISVNQLIQPKAEAEIAFVLGKDLDTPSPTSVDIINAIEYALISIEVVGSRIRDWDIKITDTIADNASASHWVVGHLPVKLSNVDLANCKMVMKNKDQIVSEGIGKNCLGSPINATRWLANKMIELSKPLRAGDLILSGAVGPMVNINAGDVFHASIDGLGSVSVSFTE